MPGTKYWTVLVVVSLAVSSCQPETPAPPFAEGVLAIVNGTPITEADLARESGKTRQHDAEEPPPDPEKILQSVILRELASRRALELGYDSDPAYRGELQRMEAQLAAFKRRKLAEVYFARERERRSTVNDDAVRRYYRENAATIGSEFHVLQILRRDERGIEADLEALRAGRPFTEVAAQRFPDLPPLARDPWDLGYLRWEQVPAAWWDAIGGLAPGETSGIIRGPNERFWIVHLVDRREIPDVGFDDVAARIGELLAQEEARRFREELDRELMRDARISYPDNR